MWKMPGGTISAALNKVYCWVFGEAAQCKTSVTEGRPDEEGIVSFRGWETLELADLVLVGDLITSPADCSYVPDICSHACQSMGLWLKFLP